MADPSPPQLAADLVTSDRRGIEAHDEWIDERVVGLDLGGAEAARVDVTGCALERVLATGARLERLRLVDVRATDCDFSGALLPHASFLRVELRNCRLAGVVLSEARLRHVRFVGCKLDDANLRFADIEHVSAEDSSLREADCTGATLATTGLRDCDLRGLELSQATLDGVHFGGSRLDGLRGMGPAKRVVIAGDQVLPLALGMFADLGIEIEE
jgi:uncharacterized protein YjbI with pentapeptide repeats